MSNPSLVEVRHGTSYSTICYKRRFRFQLRYCYSRGFFSLFDFWMMDPQGQTVIVSPRTYVKDKEEEVKLRFVKSIFSVPRYRKFSFDPLRTPQTTENAREYKEDLADLISSGDVSFNDLYI